MGVFRISAAGILWFLERVLYILETPISGRTLVCAPSSGGLVEINVDGILFIRVVVGARIVFGEFSIEESDVCRFFSGDERGVDALRALARVCI